MSRTKAGHGGTLALDDLGDVTVTQTQVDAARLVVAERCDDAAEMLEALGIGAELAVVVAE